MNNMKFNLPRWIFTKFRFATQQNFTIDERYKKYFSISDMFSNFNLSKQASKLKITLSHSKIYSSWTSIQIYSLLYQHSDGHCYTDDTPEDWSNFFGWNHGFLTSGIALWWDV